MMLGRFNIHNLLFLNLSIIRCHIRTSALHVDLWVVILNLVWKESLVYKWDESIDHFDVAFADLRAFQKFGEVLTAENLVSKELNENI